jgi:hypothetical protein
MRGLGPRCETAAEWLEAGTIAAWRAGMVQYRVAALDAARRLTPTLAATALGITWNGSADEWQRLVERLGADPWLSPTEAPFPAPELRSIRCAAVAGAFRGFGGTLLRPPVVNCDAGRLLATDGDRVWQVVADIFGNYLHPLSAAAAGVATQRSANGVRVESDGHVHWGGLRGRFPQLVGVTSVACTGPTLAVTTATSHHVYLLARTAA